MKGYTIKYIITKPDGKPVDPEGVYFILKLNSKHPPHRIASCIAARAYGDREAQSGVGEGLANTRRQAGEAMTAAQLCAPLDRCRLIPSGEFGETWFVHARQLNFSREPGEPKWHERVIPRVQAIIDVEEEWEIVASAPTLEETLANMGDEAYMEFVGNTANLNAADALDAWLAAKGEK